MARLDPARREEENELKHTRQEEPGVLEHVSIQSATARKQPGVMENEARQRRMANANKHVVMAPSL